MVGSYIAQAHLTNPYLSVSATVVTPLHHPSTIIMLVVARIQGLVTVCTHGNFIVLPHWETLLPDWYPTQSHYPDTELTSSCPIILMPSARLGSNKCNICMSLIWLDWDLNSRPSTRETALYQSLHSADSTTASNRYLCVFHDILIQFN